MTPHASTVDTRRASLRAIYIIWYRDVLRYWRDRWRIIASLAQPLLFLVVFGTGLRDSLSGLSSGSTAAAGMAGTGTAAGAGNQLDYVQFMYPGIIGMAILFTAMFAAMSIVWDREFGFLKEVLVAPINRSAVAIGKTLGSATQAMVQGLLLLVLAPLVHVKLSALAVIELVPLTFFLAFALSALGVAVAARMHSMQGFQVMMNFIIMPMFFLSGALFPLSNLPTWMTVLTRVDPASYGIDPLRRTVLRAGNAPETVVHDLQLTIGAHHLSILTELAILLAFGCVMLTIAIRAFRLKD